MKNENKNVVEVEEIEENLNKSRKEFNQKMQQLKPELIKESNNRARQSEIYKQMAKFTKVMDDNEGDLANLKYKGEKPIEKVFYDFLNNTDSLDDFLHESDFEKVLNGFYDYLKFCNFID